MGDKHDLANPSTSSTSATSAATNVPVGEINHITCLADNLGHLYMNDEYSDIVLVVAGEKIPAHKVILASRSDYFRAMLFGGMKESQEKVIELKSTSLTAFKHLLKYIYSGRMSLTYFREDGLLELLGLAHKYGFIQLQDSIAKFMEAVLNVKNACLFYEASVLYGLSSLAEVCSSFIDQHALTIIQNETFLTLTPTTVKAILSRDSFCADEIIIFKAVKSWFEANPDAPINDIISCIRLPLIKLNDLLTIVRPSSLVSADAILDAIQQYQLSRNTDLRYRGLLRPEENVAKPKLKAQVLTGDNKSALLDGDISNYDTEKGFTRHLIDDADGQGIVIELGVQCIINHIKMLLWDKELRAYSYHIEVSMDRVDWVRIIDHTQYLCRSWQQVYFEPRVVKYIRIRGTQSTVNRFFLLVSFECMFTNRPFLLDSNGLVIPDHNVATIENSALVIEGVSRSRNALINGKYNEYDWETGYTCHQIGSGAIVIQLAQPYVVDSMKLLLWDIDKRTYSYYIEVSVDYLNWQMVADRRDVLCKSWQLISFSKRPVVYIRITGTYNSANEVFHCVHFECPASDFTPSPASDSLRESNLLPPPAIASSLLRL
ncbi:BTB/POZ domain-containing protein 9-like [Tetranychus urticae]|uniref:BTB domain-containing protein n=1 Tax=Tetranychus urticae TaxID=32264 RepID=T1K0Q1_TETUR|nr:BTB/POZ domain-containing protein 9-like [Tetranychus urticae]XP_015781243.1 BTB/POZ domain-containing protein 9-like [Tetranychus urticae]